MPVPADLGLPLAAAAMLQGMTAHYLAHATYRLGPGDTCLVHAAAGGVGLLLCQMAKRAGARVIGTVSTEEKAALARGAGADEIILYTQADFAVETRRITAGRGVDVVYDSVGRTTFAQSLDCLRPRGMMVLFGQSERRRPAAGAADPRAEGVALPHPAHARALRRVARRAARARGRGPRRHGPRRAVRARRRHLPAR